MVKLIETPEDAAGLFVFLVAFGGFLILLTVTVVRMAREDDVERTAKPVGRPRHDPTYKPPLPPFPPSLRVAPDPRPVNDPRWGAFCEAMGTAGFARGVTAHPSQYDKQGGACFWRLFCLARGESP